MRPPALGGEELGDRFDVVTHMHGLGNFEDEYGRGLSEVVDGVELKLLPLDRVAASKRAAGRSKDQAQLAAIEVALATLAHGRPGSPP